MLVDLLVQLGNCAGADPCAPQRFRHILDSMHGYASQVHLDHRLFDRRLSSPVALYDGRFKGLLGDIVYATYVPSYPVVSGFFQNSNNQFFGESFLQGFLLGETLTDFVAQF